MTVAARPRFEKHRVFSTFAAVYGIGYLSYMLMPLQVGAIIESMELDEAQAGTAATIELISLAVVLVVLAPKISVFNKRKLALIGAALVISGHFLSAMVNTYTLLLPCKVCTGMGAGMAIAAGNAVVASYNEPQRLFAVILTIGQMQAACLLFLSPAIISLWAHSGIYCLLALWSCVMALLLFKLPPGVARPGKNEPHIEKSNYRVFLLPSVLAMVLLGAGDASLWAFQERIAVSLGLRDDVIGLVLGSAVFAGMLGAATAALVGNRIGRLFPVISGLLWMAVCYLVITHATSQTVYVAMELSYLFAYGFVIPYLFGINGELDPGGGAMVAANGCNLIGISLGPICAGYIIVHSGYSTVGFTISLFAIVAMTMYLPVVRKVHFQSPRAKKTDNTI